MLLLFPFFSEHCSNFLDQICAQSNISKIENNVKSQMLKPVSRRNQEGDFYLSFLHPSLSDWSSKLEYVSQKLLESSYQWEYPLSSAIVEQIPQNGQLIRLFVNQQISIPKMMQETSRFISSPRESNSVPQFCDLIISVCSDNGSEDWDNVRVRCVSEALQSMTNRFTESGYCCLITIPTKGELDNDEKLRCYKGLEKVTRKQESNLIANVSSVRHFIQPRFDWTEVEVTEQVVYWVSKLYDVIKERGKKGNLNRVILVTNDSLFVPLHKSALLTLSLLDTSSINIIVVPVSRVSHDQNLNDFSSWLKNYIITKSVTDEESVSVRVDEELVYNLYQTCLRLTLLSSPHDSVVKVEADNASRYIFIQYNIARLSHLIRLYQSQMQIEWEESALEEEDFTLFSTDEWILIQRHVSNFKPLVNQVALNYLRFPFHRLINYLHNLCKDLSSYYRKVRILVQDLPHTKKLVKSRIRLMEVIRDILIFSLSMMSVKFVEKM